MIISKYVMSKIMSGLGSKKSEAKAASSRENGKKGGRPPGRENTAPGDPIPWMSREEITEKVKVNPVTNCWEWQGGLNAGGYGFLFWPMGDMMPRKGRAKSFLAHRVSYTIFKGAIPIFLHIDHLCSVRNCVNPQHLEAVTPSENARRAQAKKRPLSGACVRGHSDNWGQSRGHRYCKKCHAENVHRYKAKKRVDKPIDKIT